MSDSDRWLLIVLLVGFLVGGLFWLVLARMRRPAAPAVESGWQTAPGDDLDLVSASATQQPVSTADVTQSRQSDASGAVAPGGVELDSGAAPARGVSAMDGLPVVAEPPTVGSEISDTSWSGQSAQAAEPAALTTAPAAAPAEAAPPVEAAPLADVPPVEALETAPADLGHAETEATQPQVAAFAAVPEAEAGAVEPATFDDAMVDGGHELGDVATDGGHEHGHVAGTAEPGEMASVASMPAGVEVAEVHHGADGHDHGDHEWVVIRNGSDADVQLEGWKLADNGEKHVYMFPAYSLAPGESVRVHMARSEDSGADLYVGRNNRWWNDTGDCAYLYDADGTLVHTHCYGDALA